MEHFLRNGNQEEIDYQRQHGGTVSDLFKGGKDNMISTITTVGTPHNGTPAADKLGTRKIVKDAMNRIGRLSGSRLLDLNLGFSQWGFKQNQMKAIQNMLNALQIVEFGILKTKQLMI